ncbi:hypothetical protein Scep_030586 [Stephania cephalantha]|uniref:Uncharacterized protein n=1 Tax=Stephania cephalantha TaxID=152367 RepID=A0AAP0DZW0_9MAGN
MTTRKSQQGRRRPQVTKSLSPPLSLMDSSVQGIEFLLSFAFLAFATNDPLQLLLHFVSGDARDVANARPVQEVPSESPL